VRLRHPVEHRERLQPREPRARTGLVERRTERLNEEEKVYLQLAGDYKNFPRLEFKTKRYCW
jgi:hypothetical protein